MRRRRAQMRLLSTPARAASRRVPHGSTCPRMSSSPHRIAVSGRRCAPAQRGRCWALLRASGAARRDPERRGTSRTRQEPRRPAHGELRARRSSAKGCLRRRGTRRTCRCRRRGRRARLRATSHARGMCRSRSRHGDTSCTGPGSGRAAATCGNRCSRAARPSFATWGSAARLRARGKSPCTASRRGRTPRRCPHVRGRTRPRRARPRAVRRKRPVHRARAAWGGTRCNRLAARATA